MVDEYDEDSVEERVGEQNVGREENVGEEDQRVVDRVEEDYDLEEAQTLESKRDNEMHVVGSSFLEYTLEPGWTPLVSSDQIHDR